MVYVILFQSVVIVNMDLQVMIAPYALVHMDIHGKTALILWNVVSREVAI